MAQYTHQDVKRVTFDTSDIKIGESIFSKHTSNKCTLCVKKEEDWEIFTYDNGHITIYSHPDPSMHIIPNNMIFDKEKTEWVSKYWKNIRECETKINGFKDKIKYSFRF